MFRRRASSQSARGGESGNPRFPGPAAVPTIETIGAILSGYGLVHHVDDDGDLVAPWEQGDVYFFFYGERKEVVQARLYLHRRFDVDSRATLALVLDEWNRTRLSPKAYTVLPDDGLVGVCAEQVFDFEFGVTADQLKFTIGQWIDSLLRFAVWLDEQV